ncbi:hypothetical protein J2S54_006860 [Streptomyces sp. DSM 42143]|nr:hypothetical protein [Streptomyces sp. DSM 42143]
MTTHLPHPGLESWRNVPHRRTSGSVIAQSS